MLCLFSGYGSQAVSSNTLSSEDSLSVRSISVDETPETEVPTATNVMSKYVLQQQQDSSAKSCDRLLSPPDVSLASTTSPGDDDGEEDDGDDGDGAENTTPVANINNVIVCPDDDSAAVPFESVTKMSITSSSSGSEKGKSFSSNWG